MASDDKNDKETRALYFDGEDETKWEAWSLKTLAYAQKKGHAEAFTKTFEFGSDESKWTEAEKAHKVKMQAAWSQLALCVLGHALKSVMRVKSMDPKEAWDRLREEYELAEITDVIN